MNNKISRELFKKIWRLQEKQPWLQYRLDEILALTDECDSISEQDLVVNLLERFLYLDKDNYRAGMLKLVDYLRQSFPLSEAQFYAMQIGGDPDSSAEVMYRIQALISHEHDLDIYARMNMSKIPERPIDEKPHIVILDEFIGSGQTFRSRMSHLRNREKCLGIEIDKNKVHFCFLAGMSDAVNEMKAEFGVDIYCAYTLDKGIAGYYAGIESDGAYQRMSRLESMLADPCPDSKDPLPSLGFNGAEALYHREEGNTPNSVFPIFWWKYRQDAGILSKRQRLLRRRR